MKNRPDKIILLKRIHAYFGKLHDWESMPLYQLWTIYNLILSRGQPVLKDHSTIHRSGNFAGRLCLYKKRNKDLWKFMLSKKVGYSLHTIRKAISEIRKLGLLNEDGILIDPIQKVSSVLKPLNTKIINTDTPNISYDADCETMFLKFVFLKIKEPISMQDSMLCFSHKKNRLENLVRGKPDRSHASQEKLNADSDCAVQKTKAWIKFQNEQFTKYHPSEVPSLREIQSRRRAISLHKSFT